MLNDSTRHDATGQVAVGPRPGAIVLVAPQLLPEGWRERAVGYYAVWLDSDEVSALGGAGQDALPADLRGLVPLVASGLSANAIADRLHVSPRTVHRRLGRLRRLVGAGSHSELVAALVHRCGHGAVAESWTERSS